MSALDSPAPLDSPEQIRSHLVEEFGRVFVTEHICGMLQLEEFFGEMDLRQDVEFAATQIPDDQLSTDPLRQVLANLINIWSQRLDVDFEGGNHFGALRYLVLATEAVRYVGCDVPQNLRIKTAVLFNLGDGYLEHLPNGDPFGRLLARADRFMVHDVLSSHRAWPENFDDLPSDIWDVFARYPSCCPSWRLEKYAEQFRAKADLGTSKRLLEIAVRANPDRRNAWRDISRIMEAQDDLSGALEVLETRVLRGAHDWSTLGTCERLRRMIKEGGQPSSWPPSHHSHITDAQLQAIEQSPGEFSHDDLLRLAKQIGKNARSNPALARKWEIFQRALLHHKPRNLIGFILLSRALEYQGKIAEAISVLETEALPLQRRFRSGDIGKTMDRILRLRVILAENAREPEVVVVHAPPPVVRRPEPVAAVVAEPVVGPPPPLEPPEPPSPPEPEPVEEAIQWPANYTRLTPELWQLIEEGSDKCDLDRLRRYSQRAQKDGEWVRVVAFQRAMTMLAPHNSKSWFFLALALEQLGQIEEAIGILREKVLPFKPGDRAATEVLRRLEQAQQQPPPAEEPAAPPEPVAEAVVDPTDPATAEELFEDDPEPEPEPSNINYRSFGEFLTSLRRVAGNWDPDYEPQGTGWVIIPEVDQPLISDALGRFQRQLFTQHPKKIKANKSFWRAFDNFSRGVRQHGNVNTRALGTLQSKFESL